MGWSLATISAGWLAAMTVMAAASLPVAALTKLHPSRYCRLSAFLWQAVALAGWGAFFATLVAAPIWFSDPPDYIRHSPHLERVLPHVCFRVVRDTVGDGYLAAGSIVAVVLLILGLVRLITGLLAERRTSRALMATARTTDGPDGGLEGAPASSSLSRLSGQPAVTLGFLHPLVLMTAGALAGVSSGASSAVIAHERVHVRWRDPLTQLLLGVTAWCFPGVGWIVAANWRRHSEHAADTFARATAGEVAWREAMRALSGEGAGLMLADRMAAAEGPISPSPAIAAAGGWLLLAIAAWPFVYPYVAMSLFCWIETTWHAWD
jgi:Zn-dependent protease with chaperone function